MQEFMNSANPAMAVQKNYRSNSNFTDLDKTCDASLGRQWKVQLRQLRTWCARRWCYCTAYYQLFIITSTVMYKNPSVLWRCWLGGRKGIRPVKKQWYGAGMVICLERCADFHTTQLMPLPLTIFSFSKTQTGFTFLVPAHPGSPGQGAVKWVCEWCTKICNIKVTSTDKYAQFLNNLAVFTVITECQLQQPPILSSE